jgi:CheY-like chemotaxis protein
MTPDEFARASHELNDALHLMACRSERLLESLEAWDPIRLAVQEIESDIRRAMPLAMKLSKSNDVEAHSSGARAKSGPRPGEDDLYANFELSALQRAKYKLSNPQKPTLLYVDDQPERLVVLKAVLESTGYQVLTADSALKGLELFLAEPIDLVVLDYYMPSMDGGAVATKMRRLRPNVPIIIFSGALTLPELVIAMVDGFISTSEEPEMLLEKIASLLNAVQAQAS